MKNLSLLCALFLTLSIFSCKDDFQKTPNEYSASELESNLILQNVVDWNENLNVFNSGNVEDENYFVGAINHLSKDASAQMITDFYQSIADDENKPNSLVFYTTESPKQLSKLDRDNVYAVSAFTVLNNKMYHDLYVKEAGTQYLKDEYFSSEVSSVSTNVPGFLLSKVLKPQSGLELSYLLVVGKSDFSLNQPVDEFTLKSTWYTKQVASQRAAPWDVDVARCDSPCSQSESGACEVYEGGLSQCVSVGCAFREIEEEMYANSSFPTAALNDAFNAELLHELEEDFLWTTTFGTKYTNYYYGLSAFLIDQFDLSISIKTTMLLPQVNAAAKKLLNPGANANEVLVSADFASALKGLLNDYRNLSKNVDYQQVLDDIESDVIKYEGKTIFEFVKAVSDN